jgi:hypothetical protein
LLLAADAASRERCEALLRAALVQRGREVKASVLRGRAAVLAALFDGLTVRSVRDPAMDKPQLVTEIRRLILALIEA